ncbi:MAG: hypothetical protein Q8K93_29450 [Reyranella sp.]|uniref:hypothetical protein n=1 Tax=Reyranella sp. TaxID=1929291 RepID=UPI002732164F|nr:hypothetical protein [Reyranella sp.]MDP1966316.1 hypothetical protein [Reyranella sp.]MDP2376659.1 hypothetical protein [Reyranella sp.]
MNENCRNFVLKLCNLAAPLAETHRETIDEWSPGEPPTTIVFADIGQRVVDDIEVLDPVVEKALFLLIEEGMMNSDEELGRSVATGLIEAMVGRAASRGTWDNVRARLGKLSRAHADWWYSGRS